MLKLNLSSPKSILVLGMSKEYQPQSKTATPGQDSLTERLVREVRQTGMEREEYKPVLMKAAKEQLTSSQARKVAEAVKQAETPEERQAILETPIDNPMFDRIVRAIMKLFDNQMR